MKKQGIIAAVLVAITSVVGIFASSTLPPADLKIEMPMANKMQLFNQETDFAIAVIEGNSVTFYDPILRNELESTGLAIPPSEQEAFGGKERVMPEDPEFARAFYAFYANVVFASSQYNWEVLDN